jgi:hypothetical protein
MRGFFVCPDSDFAVVAVAVFVGITAVAVAAVGVELI